MFRHVNKQKYYLVLISIDFFSLTEHQKSQLYYSSVSSSIFMLDLCPNDDGSLLCKLSSPCQTALNLCLWKGKQKVKFQKFSKVD